jgi:16S rRNA (cytidine1402-2'-O)-methyltransferase
LVFYESPYRLAAFVADALAVYGDRRAALANDLTKLYEQVERGTLSELLAATQGKSLKGEFVLVVEGADGRSQPPAEDDNTQSLDDEE